MSKRRGSQHRRQKAQKPAAQRATRASESALRYMDTPPQMIVWLCNDPNCVEGHQ
jgi:hypothetical protein